jgi:hypothetical protein
MTEKQEEATRIIEAIGNITLNECYVPVSGSYSEMDANELLMLYDELIREQTKKPKTFKRTIELDDVYKEVFKRVWQYNR